MPIISDNQSGGDLLESWAVEHMAREVWFEVSERERICRGCVRYREGGGKLFARCDQRTISLAGGKCPEGKW